MGKIFLEVKATLQSPCCISEQPAMGNEVDTLNYIPGSALRGMLAEVYLQNGNEPNEDFRGLFCDGDICFPNLYPLDGITHIRPIPLSIYTCKAQPGFNNDESQSSESSPHGAWNLLFEDYPGYNGHPRRRCHQNGFSCGHASLKPHTGYYNGSEQHPKSYIPKNIIATRTAIAYQTQSALTASLHTQNELPAGMEFWGLLTVEESAVQKLGDGLKDFPVIGYTGRRRMGKVELEFPPASLKFQPHFLSFPVEEGFAFFALTLLSDTILIDELLRPIITLTPEILKDEQQVEFPQGVDVSIVKAFCATRRISGWHSVAKIFKPDDSAIVKGSTFLMRIPQTAKAEVENWMNTVVYSGIGLRRSEGFGQFCFDEPLHKKAEKEKGGPL